MVAVADKRWPFTRGSNFKALSGEILMFLLGGHTWTLDRILSLDSRVIEISMQQLPCRIDILQTRVPLKFCTRCLLKGSLRNDYDDGNENVKKEIGLDKQNNNSARASRFFCTFFCHRCTTTTWNCLISRFAEDGNKRQHLSFSFPELWCSPLEFNSKKLCQHLTNLRRWNKRD